MIDAMSRPTTNRESWGDRIRLRDVVTIYWRNGAITLLSFAMLAWTFQTGLSLGMANTLSQISWARSEFSTGVAISRLRFGAPGYLLLNDVWTTLGQNGFSADVNYRPLDPDGGIAAALNQQIDLSAAASRPDMYLKDWGDD